MELFLLRHGHAIAQAPRDRDRQLSDKGKLEVNSVISTSLPDLANVEKIFVSPYVRTQQTAEIVSSLLNFSPDKMTTVNDLTPDSDPRALFPLIERAAVQSLMFITHQPLVGTFLDYFCSLEPGRHFMGTSALAAVDAEFISAGHGELRWLKQSD